MGNFDKLPERFVNIVILNEIEVQINGLLDHEINRIKQKYSLYTKNYRHTRAFKLNRWDGKKSFITAGGKTSIHLLPDILKMIYQMGRKIKIEDKRYPKVCIPPLIDENYLIDLGVSDKTLGKHQVDGCNAVFAEGSGIVLAGTGAGKTIMTYCLAKHFETHCNYSSITIVPSVTLANQTLTELKELGLENCGPFFDSQKDFASRHIVSTWQTLQHIPEYVAKFQLVIVDECHGSQSDVLKKIITEYAHNAPVRVGLTGTLPEHECEAMCVRYALGEPLFTVKAHELIELGWLAKLKINMLMIEEDLKDDWNEYIIAKEIEHDQEMELRKAEGLEVEEYKPLTYIQYLKARFAEYKDEQNYLQTYEPRLEMISDMAVAATEHRGNSLILVNNIAFGKRLAEKIEGAVFVHGKDKQKARKEIYDLFETRNDLIVVATYGILSVGVSINRIFNLFTIDVARSYVRVMQTIGRGLRKAQDKDKITVYDIGSNLPSSKSQFNTRKKLYTQDKYPFSTKKISYAVD